MTHTPPSSAPVAEPPVLSFGRGKIDFTRKEIVYRNGQRSRLLPREIELLQYLAARPGVPVARNELLANVWKVNAGRSLTRTVDMHISHLRRKLRDDPQKPAVIVTIHGHGYMLAKRSATTR